MLHDFNEAMTRKRCGFDAAKNSNLTACPKALKVVPIRAAPPLTDIAGRLENFVKQIRESKLDVANVTLVVSDAGHAISVYDFGAHITPQHTIGVLQMAQQIVMDAVPYRGRPLEPKRGGAA